ncbi:hypothetical protein AB0I34_40685 [Kribbella sp. NPDC050281]|uniref:hypothetical protein n=1 Tax=Kribbella sp. NPDC050281 TaxID=3155515 RepID=UPI0033DCB5F4
MTNEPASVQHDLDQWEHDLTVLAEELAAGDLSLPAQLMATVQETLTAYRGRIVPRLALTRAPAVADELNLAVDRLEAIRRDLVATGPTPKLQTQLSETLAVLRVLVRIALRG